MSGSPDTESSRLTAQQRAAVVELLAVAIVLDLQARDVRRPTPNGLPTPTSAVFEAAGA